MLEADSEVAGTFTEHDVDFMQGVANLLGVALERRRAEDELRRLNEELEQRVSQAVEERRQAEDALRQSQKMEAIGQLTGGVAHDFNNLLTVIIGNLDLLARAVSVDSKIEGMIATARKAAARGAQLTSQLLAFARRQTLRPESRPINGMAHEFEVLMSRMLGESVCISFELDPLAGACHVDPAQFGSALLNLAINSRDAMPSGGTMTIRTRNVSLTAREAARHPDAPLGEYVMLEVSDTGMGMPPAVLERATEPFYTTKEVGQGTGLGLSQVHGFVRQSGGFLTLESTVGEGTTARLYFPKVVAAAPASLSDPAQTFGSGTILVVEDDPDVRDLLLALLEDLSYTTIAAGNGREAIQLLEDPDKHIDLLLTDMVMPGGMTGLELIRAARSLRPDLPTVLTSGYSSGNIASHSVEEDVATQPPVVSKPFQQEDLARVIGAILTPPKASADPGAQSPPDKGEWRHTS